MQSTQPLTLADALFPRVATNDKTAIVIRNIALMVGFAAFVALFAQIQVRVPWTVVPITGQTFAALVAGGALGAWRGAGALSIYTVVGMLGAPVFTPPSSATSGAWDLHFVLPWSGAHGPLDFPSGGYILGFILAAAIVGFLAERGWDRGARVQIAMLLGTAVVYIPGLIWLAQDLNVSFSRSLELGLYPFVVGDLMKLLLASMVLPGAWALIGRRRKDARPDTTG